MTPDILALDVGTSTFKLGVFGPELDLRAEAHRTYAPRAGERGRAEIEPEAWWAAFEACCDELRESLTSVGVVAMAVTTPGLTPMAGDGSALAPAVLFFDGRSHEQARAIRELVGEELFLREACNLPVSGGSSLSTILWFREASPATWDATICFGHCNTYMVRQLTGRWAVDPSTTSITGLYNTARNDLTWNRQVLELARIPEDKLPPLLHSHEPVGEILPAVADRLGLPRDCVVLCGGNDAVLAAMSGGLTEPGDINIISGTCDIANVCTDRPIASPAFNVRCHVVPGRWLTFFVLNTGGAALDWFHRVFCRELDDRQFYEDYVPSVLDRFFGQSDPRAREADLPEYEPYLGGSRYSLERLTATLSGMTLETSRDDLLLSVIRANAAYLGRHLDEVAGLVRLGATAGLSGGAARIRGMTAARRRWTRPLDYVFQAQSSLLGAAMLGRMYQSGAAGGNSKATRPQEAVT